MDPGVSETRLRVGVLLPPADVLPEAGAEVRALLQAWATDTNHAGGAFGRSIELVFAAPFGDAKERAASAREFIRREQLFALVSSFTDGADAELAAVAEDLHVPLLATISSHPQSGGAPNRYVHDLCAGIGEQGKALAHFAATHIEASKRAEAVIFLGDPAALPAIIKSTRILLLPASLAHPSLFERPLPIQVFLSFPIALGNPGSEALARYRRLAEDAEITHRYQVSQFAALASAQLLMAALECAGRDVTREKVLDCIDRVTKLETGFVPPLTYGSNRHIGSIGSFIVELQSDRRPVWIDPG
jgi:ABC-type branched-subunit amino acid transport system substrate-binding protein